MLPTSRRGDEATYLAHSSEGPLRVNRVDAGAALMAAPSPLFAEDRPRWRPLVRRHSRSGAAFFAISAAPSAAAWRRGPATDLRSKLASRRQYARSRRSSRSRRECTSARATQARDPGISAGGPSRSPPWLSALAGAFFVGIGAGRQSPGCNS